MLITLFVPMFRVNLKFNPSSYETIKACFQKCFPCPFQIIKHLYGTMYQFCTVSSQSWPGDEKGAIVTLFREP